ncbi:MAG: RluA family pseudouridine synthase [Synergistetes bacterium]|nr:RluA family pseudouridine synthase [Synergistota bacterium]
MKRIVVDLEDAGRLDVFLSRKLKLSRSMCQRMVVDGHITVNGKTVQKSFVLQKGDIVEYLLPESREPTSIPQPIEIPVIYEDKDIIVVDKPAGMVVHPAPGNVDGTLVNALLYRVNALSSIRGTVRPGIVHRLDKDTSGVLIVAKNDVAHQRLAEQFSSRRVKKEYVALVSGRLDVREGEIVAPIGRSPHDRKKMAVIDGGKHAETTFRVIDRCSKASLILVRLHTGRTHQIRVHFSYINHHIVGDKIYGRKNPGGVKRMCLHAYKIVVIHPLKGERMEFISCLPKDFVECLEFFGLSLPEWICTSRK